MGVSPGVASSLKNPSGRVIGGRYRSTIGSDDGEVVMAPVHDQSVLSNA